MKKDLYELKEIEEQVKHKLNYIKSNEDTGFNNINEVKVLKNHIYEKTSKVFMYNLKKLIKLESTQKKLAFKIGISEDLMSKYKCGDAFPSIETLIYICEVYNISMEKLISTPLTVEDIEKLENNEEIELDLFEEKYYVYFLVTNLSKEGTIQEGIVHINKDKVIFKLISNQMVIKQFKGKYNVSDKLIFFNLHSLNDGCAHINMIKPNVNKSKYCGGVAMLMIPSDANSKPCVQKVLFSKIKIDRELYYDNLKELLEFNAKSSTLGHIKISQWEDELAYNFIAKLL